MSSKSEKERNRIKDEFDQIKSESGDFDITNHLAKMEDLPDLGEIEVYDYESDLEKSGEQSMEVLESLVDLYLGDIPKLKEHPYIANKMKEDAMVYSEAIFLARMTRKNFLTQMRQVDNGDCSARMHEVVNQTIGQIRENSKFLSGQRTELEKFYKTLRKDMGYEEIENNTKVEVPETKEEETTKKDDSGLITNNRSLNDMIKNAMMNRQEEEDKKKKK